MGTKSKHLRLSQQDWLSEGQAVLREAGIGNLKLSILTKRLRVSSGSFYHHFEDFEDYLTQLAKHFDVSEVMTTMEEVRKAGGSPTERIRRLAAASIKARLFPLDAAMRVWGAVDKRADASVRRAEKAGLDFLATAFQDMGFPPEEAIFRAHVLLAVNVARLHFDPKLANAQFPDRVLDLLSKDAPKRR